MTQNKKPKWDGRSRVSTDMYRKRFNEIFKKEEKEENKERKDLNESLRETPK